MYTVNTSEFVTMVVWGTIYAYSKGLWSSEYLFNATIIASAPNQYNSCYMVFA